jgi:hypothetical protein
MNDWKILRGRLEVARGICTVKTGYRPPDIAPPDANGRRIFCNTFFLDLSATPDIAPSDIADSIFLQHPPALYPVLTVVEGKGGMEGKGYEKN